VRTFVAINFSPSVRDDIHDSLADLRAAGLAVRWVDADALHITLSFLGELDDARVSRTRAAVRVAAARHDPFLIDVAGIGVFPHWRAPRVFWLAVRPAEAVCSLQHDVERALGDAGFASEDRTFTPHVTIGRANGRVEVDREALQRLTARCAATSEARTVDVMSSRTFASGPRYEPIEAVPLGAGEQ
jgi:2'-5' RNA ligase